MIKTPPKNFRPEPFQYHEELELTISTLTNTGIGLGRMDGWVVMVPFSLPGEKVRVRIFRNHKNYSEADLVEILEKSPHRVDPVCPLFGTCGGCQYQNLVYEQQLIWKQRHVKETLQQITGIDIEVNKTYASPKQYNYRSKLTPHFPTRKEEQKMPIGFLREGSTKVLIDVPQCPIATNEINRQLTIEREMIISGQRKYKRGGTLLLRHSLEGVTIDAQALISEKVGDIVFQFKAGDFFQNNPYILPYFVDYVVSEARGEGIESVVDVYCGSGLFALFAAKKFNKVAGVEVNASAIVWAKTNAKLNNLTNCEFLIGDAHLIFAQVKFKSEKTTAIIDPPRKGCDVSFLEQLMKFSPRKVVYVSCDPATQARDLKYLLRNGYKINAMQPFDLFPQTRHIESVVTMERV